MRRLLRGAARAYKLLLAFLPRGFREEWGTPMLRLFYRRSVACSRAGGLGSLIGWWIRAGVDLAKSLAREWWELRPREFAARWSADGARKNGRWSMGGSIADVPQELLHTLRSYSRSGLWTFAAIGTLVIGTGAVTGMFSLVYESLLRPLPFTSPNSLVAVTAIPETGRAPRWSLSLLERWQADDPGGIPIAGYSPTIVPLDLGGGPEYVDAGYATGNLMGLLGVSPMLGRRFQVADGREGAQPVVALSVGLWQEFFGADPGVLGRSLRLGTHQYTIVAVVGPELASLLPKARLWLSTAALSRSPYITVFSAVGRLPHGVTTAVAKDRLAAIRITDSVGGSYSGQIEPLRASLVGETKPVLLAFLAVVTGLLLIAGTNLALLLLGRAVARAGGLGVRAALGATRHRVLRGAILDGVVLGAMGGAGGLILGALLRHIVLAWIPQPLPGRTPGGLGPVVASFALLVGMILCTSLSLWATASVGVVPPTTRGSNTGTPGLRRRYRVLTVTQIAATFVMLTASALLELTFRTLSRTDVGFDPTHVGGVLFTIPASAYPDAEAQETFVQNLVARLDALPTIEWAAAVDHAPLKGLARSKVHVEGIDSTRISDPWAAVLDVGAGFFRVLAVRPIRGRVFSDADRGAAQPSVVVTRSFVRRFLSGGDPIGQRIRVGGGDWRTIVGEVRDIRVSGLTQTEEPVVFQPLAQTKAWSIFVSVLFRSRGSAAGAVPAVRASLREAEPLAAVLDAGGYEQWIRTSPTFADARFRTVVVGLLGLGSVALALIGVYGVAGYAVRRRTHELGIRIALGAGRAKIVSGVMAEGLSLAIRGVMIGAVGAWFLVRLLDPFLLGTRAHNVSIFVEVALALVAVASVASIGPALDASSVDPMEALREE